MSVKAPSRSWEWVNHVRDNCRVAAGARHLLMVIATYADATGHAHPSQRELADATGYDARHIRRLIAALEEEGWLVTEDGRGRGKRTDFAIAVEPAKADTQSRNTELEKRTPEPGFSTPKADTQSRICDDKSGHLEHEKRTSATAKADICASEYKEVEPAIEPAIEPDGAFAPPSLTPGQHAKVIFDTLWQSLGETLTSTTSGRAMRGLTELVKAKGADAVAAAFAPENVARGLRSGKYPFNAGLAGIWTAAEQAFNMLARSASANRDPDPDRWGRMRSPLERKAQREAERLETTPCQT